MDSFWSMVQRNGPCPVRNGQGTERSRNGVGKEWNGQEMEWSRNGTVKERNGQGMERSRTGTERSKPKNKRNGKGMAQFRLKSKNCPYSIGCLKNWPWPAAIQLSPGLDPLHGGLHLGPQVGDVGPGRAGGQPELSKSPLKQDQLVDERHSEEKAEER